MGGIHHPVILIKPHFWRSGGTSPNDNLQSVGDDPYPSPKLGWMNYSARYQELYNVPILFPENSIVTSDQ